MLLFLKMILLCDVCKHPNQLLNSVFFFSDNALFFKVSEYIKHLSYIKTLITFESSIFPLSFWRKRPCIRADQASMLSLTFSRVVSGLICLRLVRLASGDVVLAQSLFLEGRGTDPKQLTQTWTFTRGKSHPRGWLMKLLLNYISI